MASSGEPADAPTAVAEEQPSSNDPGQETPTETPKKTAKEEVKWADVEPDVQEADSKLDVEEADSKPDVNEADSKPGGHAGPYKKASFTPPEKQEVQEKEKPSGKVPTPILLQPQCVRELLLSKSCYAALATNNNIKGKVSFVLLVITFGTFVVINALIATLTLRWGYFRTLETLQTFDFPHVSIPCVVIREVDVTQKNLVFHDLPYASYTQRFGESTVIDSFLECYRHYYLAPHASVVSFLTGTFFWKYNVMTKIRSDRTAWRHQLRSPGSTETIGKGMSISLSVASPQLNNGSRPVVVLVTGNDLVFNKPVMTPGHNVESIDCVMVTVNYRIGLDGAANLDRDNFMGNQFANDIIQALIWINRTIDSFGGDAKRLTYLGEGSGGTLGLWLMLNPASVFVSKFWLMDPSVEIPTFSNLGSIVEDIFLEQPSPFPGNMTEEELSACYKQFKHKQPADCLTHLPLTDVVKITPKWLATIHRYLNEFPEKATRCTKRQRLR